MTFKVEAYCKDELEIVKRFFEKAPESKVRPESQLIWDLVFYLVPDIPIETHFKLRKLDIAKLRRAIQEVRANYKDPSWVARQQKAYELGGRVSQEAPIAKFERQFEAKDYINKAKEILNTEKEFKEETLWD